MSTEDEPITLRQERDVGRDVADTKSPDEWGNATFPANERGHRPFAYWKHCAADMLHGWGRHAYHEGEPMQLSAADYTAAIAAVVAGGKPYPAALSKHKPARKPRPVQQPVAQPRKKEAR